MKTPQTNLYYIIIYIYIYQLTYLAISPSLQRQEVLGVFSLVSRSIAMRCKRHQDTVPTWPDDDVSLAEVDLRK